MLVSACYFRSSYYYYRLCSSLDFYSSGTPIVFSYLRLLIILI